jgi:hypothetical protein
MRRSDQLRDVIDVPDHRFRAGLYVVPESAYANDAQVEG